MEEVDQIIIHALRSIGWYEAYTTRVLSLLTIGERKKEWKIMNEKKMRRVRRVSLERG